MLLPEKKEREYRFRLALRMGIPVFILFLILILSRFVTDYESLDTSFYVETTLLIALSIYFIFYVIYKSFDVKITDSVSKTFTREYLYRYIKKELSKNKDYTLILVSIDNLNDINERYGIKNGDKILSKVSSWISDYFQNKEIYNFPMGHIKGGDFILGFDGKKEQYNTIIELMNIKSENLVIDDIEIEMSNAIIDTTFSNRIDYLIEKLFELQEINKNQIQNEQLMNPDKLELSVINAIKNRNFLVMTQDVFSDDKVVMKECFIKLKTTDENIIHQKAYMKVLDRLGLMVEFDMMVLEENITKCCDKSNIMFAMNISPSSLRNPSFIIKAKELIISNENIKNKIVFLLNEKEYYSQIKKYNTTLKMFRDMGVLIAIDRLGAIHTSFLYLRDLDIDIVRFDSYYTKDITDKKSKDIVDGFNVMAHKKGVKTWIKMVENKEIYNVAKELNIDYIQGKYLALMKKAYEN
jgi:EAL domain-containing protein (putative c-di-GMP-specific phosphodiesterase class I)